MTFCPSDSDVQIDSKDAEIAYEKLLEFLQFNMPAGGGFAAGLILGLRSG